MWESKEPEARKGSCRCPSLHRKHAYNKKLKGGTALGLPKMLIPILLLFIAPRNYVLGTSESLSAEQGSSLSVSLGASPLYINPEHAPEGDPNFLQVFERGRNGPRTFTEELDSGDSSSDSEYEPAAKGHTPRFTRSGGVFGPRGQGKLNPNMSVGQSVFTSPRGGSGKRDGSKSFNDELADAAFTSPRGGSGKREGSKSFNDELADAAFKSPRRTRSELPPLVEQLSNMKLSDVGREFMKNFKDLSAPKETFHPREGHTFKNVVIERDHDVLDLRQKNGILTAKFKLETMDDNALTLLDHLSKNTASCTVKWVSLSKDKNAGQMHLDCKFDVKADGFSGDTPIEVKIFGFSGGAFQSVNLKSDGMSFHEQYDSPFALKREIMKAMGLDPLHECRFIRINKKNFGDDAKAFKYLSNLIENGVKNVEVVVQPMIRLFIHIKRPFSGTIESFTHEGGFMTIAQFKDMLKTRKRVEDFCSRVTRDDSTQYLLVGFNDKFMDIDMYNFERFKTFPLEILMTLTYIPYVNVNFHFLDKTVVSKTFPVSVKLLQIIKFGKEAVRKFNKNFNVKNPDYKVYSYSIQGCLEEHKDLGFLAEEKRVNIMTMIPFSDTCVNRDTNVLNLYYLNNKPTMFNFDAEIYGPDGTLIVSYKISVDYNPKAKLSYIKEEVLNRLLKDGHVVSAEELFFIKLGNKKGENARDDMLVSEVVDVMQEQKSAIIPKFQIAVNPKFDVIYRDRDGNFDRFKVEMNKTNPTKRDFTDAVDARLHERHLLKPEEHIHSVRIHPRNRKNKVNFNVEVKSDNSGHLPPGTRSDEIAAETDLRMEIPVEFHYDDGRVIRFTVNADYGATEDEIERMVKKELHRRGFRGNIPGLHFDIKNSQHNDFKEFWGGGPDVERFVLDTELANDVEVDGDVHGIPFTTHVRVHPRESMDELQRDVFERVKQNPKIRVWLEEDPKRMDELGTVVSDVNGRIYDDDEMGNDFLYSKSSRIRIGVSDHPFELVWKNPLTGEEINFCLTKGPNGRCRPLPPKMTRFPIQDFVDHLLKLMKKEGKYEEYVMKPVKLGKMYTPTLRLKELRTADGHRFNCSEIPLDANFKMLEYALNVSSEEVRALVFSLMTSDERENLAEREKNHRRYKVVINKETGDHESHLVDTDDLTETELQNLIYKNFSSVPSDARIENMKFYDDTDHEVDFAHFTKRPKPNETLRVKFSMKDDGPRPPMPQFSGVTIQPKPYETIRQYFMRAVEEPIDFGLSPMHSYTVVGENGNGNYVHFDNMLDTPIKDIKNVKTIRFVRQPAVRPDTNPTIYYSDKEPEMNTSSVTLEFDRKQESVPTLNTKIRDFLIRVPPEQMGHVKVEVDGTEIRCSLETLRDAYMIKNLTLERLFELCQGFDMERGFNHVKMNLNLNPEEVKKSATYNLLDGLGSPSGPPIANFSLYKGQTDLGLSTLVKVNVGTLNSPVVEFYAKIVKMFGESLNAINEVSVSLIKNGRAYPCNTAKALKGLKDFGKTTLAKVFQICGLPAVIPENGSYLHFHVSVNFNVSPKAGNTSSMGATIPLDLYYDEDDRMTNVYYDENLYPEIANYMDDNPDIDKGHFDKYRVTIKAEQPTHEFLTKTYNMTELPHNLTLADIFPHSKVEGLNITIDSTDGKNLGGWRSETVHPVNDFKNKFDALKRQIVLNLKTMHGDNLDQLRSFTANVGINGVKHKCHIESVSKLIKMSLDEFLKVCVDIRNINNNPSMSFGVSYDPKMFNEKRFNVKVLCGDRTELIAEGLGPEDKLPKELIQKIKAKYGDGVNGVQWGAIINKVQGDCHFAGILDVVDMSGVLGLCGVSDRDARLFNLVFFDMNYASYELLKGEFTNKGGKTEFPDVMKVTQTVKAMKSPVRVNMPFSYDGPEIHISGEDTLNDSFRKIVTSEDEFNTGNPFKIKVHTNDGDFGLEQLPKRVVNHPSRDLNGTFSFIVEDDPTGNDPGTFLNLHFPDTSQKLGDFIRDLETNPNNSNKKFYLTEKDTFISTDSVPIELLLRPIDELKEQGYFITVINETARPEKGNPLFVNILSRDGISSSGKITDLQQPLTELFAKVTKNQGDLDKMLNGKFQMLVDGFPTDCNMEKLRTIQSGMTLNSLLAFCGVTDLDHNHVVTIYFETPIAGDNQSHGLKLKVDLNEKQKEDKEVDYGTKFTVGSEVEDFLKSKKDAHVYLDVKGKDKINDFIEVDSLKFLQILSNHPEVVNMLLKLGVPQTHLGSLDSLHLVISSLTNALKGHQTYNIESGDDEPYDMEKPISAHENIVQLRKKLNDNPNLRIKGTVTLADGSKSEFDIRGKEFVHAVDGGQTFRDLTLRALSSDDANKVIHVNLASYEADEDSSHSVGSRRKLFSKTKATPAPAKMGVLPPGVRESKRPSQSLSRSSEASSSSQTSESENEEPSPVPKIKRLGGVFSSQTQKKEIKPHNPLNGPENAPKNEANPEAKNESKPEALYESKPETLNEPKPEALYEPKPEALNEPKPEPKNAPKNEVKNPPSETESVAKSVAKSVASNSSSGSSLSTDSKLDSVGLFKEVLKDPNKKVSITVKTSTGRTYDLIVRAGIIRKGIENGEKMRELLQNYLLNEDVGDVIEIEISQKLGSVFTVPLKKHVQINLPVMASDMPRDCDIQDFENPWNPPEAEWKNFTVRSALKGYSDANHVASKPIAAYLLTKEDHNNLSAEIIFDEDHPQDDAKLDRKVGEDLAKGKTLFIRYKVKGELVD